MDSSLINITKIKYLKNKAEITVGDEVYKNISLEVLYKFSIKEGEVKRDYFKDFLLENEKQNAKSFLINSLSRSSKTEMMARQKLYEKGFKKKAVEYAIEFAREYGYIDDAKYASTYAATKALNKGEYKIRFELRSKGLSEEEIEKALDNIDDEKYAKSATLLAEKYMRGKELNKKNYEKLCRHLISRGYEFELVKKIAEPYFSNEP
ncbi:MAG TPA: regulatory protein RecX [Clostridia bacterium]|jgi:regulatory protein|nr:regulatory protein RecX [Clostridia bacterium]